MRSSEAIDRGLEAYIRSAPGFAEVAPGGLWFGVRPPGSREEAAKVAILWFIQDGQELRAHGGPSEGYETVLYEVKAVALTTQGSAVVAASRWLAQLLKGAQFPVEGYQIVRCEREQRIGYVEIDGDLQWRHQGAIWDVWASPTY